MELICPYFGRCGGCSAQHIPYGLQLKGKEERAAYLLKKAGVEIGLKVFSSRPYAYRNRMDFIFHPGGLGLRRKSQWDRIVDIPVCAIANQKVNRLLAEVRGFAPLLDVFDIRKQAGTLKFCVMRSSEFMESSSLSFVMNTDSAGLASQVELVRSYAEMSSAGNVIITYVDKRQDQSVSSESFPVKGGLFLQELLGDVVLDYAVQGFFQNNPTMAIRMIGECKGILGAYPTKGAVLLDLFGGVGTFGVSLGALFREVLVVESVQESILCAGKNLQENKVPGKAVVLDAAKIARLGIPSPFFAIVDPPRTGMARKTIDWLLNSLPEAIIYISCNPEELAKELPLFLGKYRVQSARLFDLFPQTPHIELMVELRKA